MKKHRAASARGGEPAESAAAPKRRLLAVVAAVAVAALLLEVAWFSDPVQEWWTGRQSLEALTRAVGQQPGSTRLRYHLAAALLRAGRPAEAYAQAQQGTVMDPDSARLHRLAGLAAAAAGPPGAAWPHLTRARDLGDRSAALLETMARIQMDQQRMGEAMRLLEEAVRRDPRRAESWHLLGRSRGALGIPKGGLEAMERATALAPGVPRYWLGLADAHLFLDDGAGGLRAADRALALAPDDPEVLLARARSLALTPDRDPEADAAFRRALERAAPDEVTTGLVSSFYGQFLLERGRPAEAIPHLERASRASPEHQPTAYALAQAYRRTRAHDRAAAVLKRWEEMSSRARDVRYLEARVIADPQSPEARIALARALERAGRSREAALHRRQAAALQARRGVPAPAP